MTSIVLESVPKGSSKYLLQILGGQILPGRMSKTAGAFVRVSQGPLKGVKGFLGLSQLERCSRGFRLFLRAWGNRVLGLGFRL